MKILKQTLLLGSLILASASLQAQTSEQRSAITVFGSILNYDGDLGSEYTNFEFKDINPGGGITFNQYLTSSFDFDGSINLGSIDYSNAGNSFNTGIYCLTAAAKYKFNNGYALKEDAPISPYLIAGPGITIAQSKGTYSNGSSFDKDFSTIHFMGGAGLKFVASPNFNIIAQVAGVLPADDRLDGINRGKLDSYFQSSLGFSFNLGIKKDRAPEAMDDKDGDGVQDLLDVCPGTPGNVLVDAAGCPIDSDSDDIPDYLDKCPNQKGPERTSGCPDSDKDGVIDADDKCGDTPQGVNVDSKGCPIDSDDDGIADYEDDCPKVKGSKTKMGCPEPDKVVQVTEVTEEIVQQLGFIAKEIRFETNKTKLRSSSVESLDEVVVILEKYPMYNLTIEGHTDNVGDPAYNLELSEGRANEVRTYLIENGIKRSRISAKGFGETKPVAENDNATGRAENRRVELKLELPADSNR